LRTRGPELGSCLSARPRRNGGSGRPWRGLQIFWTPAGRISPAHLPEKLGGSDVAATRAPNRRRHRIDHVTVCGRSCANSRPKPLAPVLIVSLSIRIRRVGLQKIWSPRRGRQRFRRIQSTYSPVMIATLQTRPERSFFSGGFHAVLGEFIQ
jgi:hypothetical protein